MANSQIKTRIIHKHDTAANWELAVNFIPKQGEIIIYDKDSTYNHERFKIGDGATLISALPFANDALKAEIQTLLNGKASVSSVTQLSNRVDGKVDKDGSKVLSTNDFTNTLKSKLDGIASGAQVNQNAFSNITDGTTTIAADSTTDTLTLVAGSNISLALDATNDKVTISATNATYDAAGSSLGLVKSGGDVTISSGVITVNDDSHNHVISNVDGLQNALDAKVDKSDYETFKTNVNTLLDSDDETLDQMSEIVAYTKNNKGLIDSITTSKQDKITGAATTITSSDLTANRVLISDGNGKVAASSSITTTELGYLDGTTSNIQTQITTAKNTADAKLAAADITVTVTGTGNAITAASYDDKGTITLTKGATFNNYSLPTASSTLGGVKTTSTVTSASGYTAVPIIDGIPYYKNVTKTDVTNALGYTPPTTNTQYTAGTGLSLSNGAFSVKTGYTNSGKNYKVQADSSGNLYVNVPWTDSTPVTSVFGRTGAVTLTKSDVTTALGYTPPTSNTTYSAATYSTLGLVKPAYTSTGAASLTTGAATNTTTPTIAAKTTTSGRYYAVEADKNGVLFVNVPWSDTNTHAVSSVAGKTGAVTLTKSDVGLGNVENKSSATIRGELTKANVTTALGYTPPTTDTNTHYTTRLYAGASGTAANAAATNPYLKITDDNTYRNQVRFVGGGATTVSSDANGNITISSTNTTYSAGTGLNLSGTSFSIKNHVFKGYSRDEIGTAPNFDTIDINGLFEVRSSNETTGESGIKPFNSFGPMLSFKYSNTMFQIAANQTGSLLWRAMQSASPSLAGINWQTCLDSRNYTDYTVTKTGSGASGTWGISVTGSSGSLSDYSTAGSLTWRGDHMLKSNNRPNFQLHFGSNQMYIYNNSNAEYYPILHSNNYTNYTVTKTGIGASGTWGINITGSAATATRASQDGNGADIASTYLKLSGGTMSGKLTLNTSVADHATPMTQILCINCDSIPSGTTLTDKNAPGIGFHIGNNSWGSLILNNGNFKFINDSATGYMPVHASAFHGSGANLTSLNAGNISSGTLAVARGGTGITSNPSMLVNLGSTSAASVFAASPRPGITGTLGIGNGGTGATSKSGARTNLGITSGTSLPSSASAGDIFFLYS